jgi:hypothetical protein
MKFLINAANLLSRHYRGVGFNFFFFFFFFFFSFSFLFGVCVGIGERPCNCNMFPLLKSGLEEPLLWQSLV